MPEATRIQIPAELEQRMDAAIARYPSEHRRSAAMPLLHLRPEHLGFINDEATFWIAEKLGLQPINILEVVTFYPMFRQHPAGKTHIRICHTLSCAMSGGLELMENLCATLGLQGSSDGEETHNPIAVSADGAYSVEFVECLASCHTAPVCMVGDELREKINPESAADLVKERWSPVHSTTGGGLETAAPLPWPPHPLEHRLVYKNIGRPG